MKKYRFIVSNRVVLFVAEHNNSVTATAEDMVITDLETAKILLPLAGVNIDKILEFEKSLPNEN